MLPSWRIACSALNWETKQTFLSGACSVNNSHVVFRSGQFALKERHSKWLDLTHYFKTNNLESLMLNNHLLFYCGIIFQLEICCVDIFSISTCLLHFNKEKDILFYVAYKLRFLGMLTLKLFLLKRQNHIWMSLSPLNRTAKGFQTRSQALH